MMVAFFALLVTLAAVLLWWVRQTFTFWNGKAIAHVTFWQYMRFACDVYTKPLNEAVRRAYTRHGRLYGSYQDIVPTLVVGEPDVLREVLVTKFKNFSDRSLSQTTGSELWKKAIMNLSGDEWKKARTIFTPALTTTKLRTIFPKVKSIAMRMALRVKDAALEKKPVDLFELAKNTSLDMAATIHYSVNIDSRNDKDHALVKCLEDMYVRTCGWRIVMLFLMPTLYKVLLYRYPPKPSAEALKTFISHLIEERRTTNKEEDDFIQVFMNADYNWEDNEGKTSDSAEVKKMSPEEITAQVIPLLVAGVEGVATVITAAAYYLALNPGCQDRVIAEVDKALTKVELTYDVLQEMPYLDACVKEATRLCSPDSIDMRVCTEETTVAGIHFKPGMCVDIPLAGIHHDPEYYPEPDNFDPERFMPGNKDAVRPFTYLPFGAGPRGCVGKRLALLQAETTLACLLQHVKFDTCPETMIPLRFKPAQMLLGFDGSLILQAVPRQRCENDDCQ